MDHWSIELDISKENSRYRTHKKIKEDEINEKLRKKEILLFGTKKINVIHPSKKDIK